MLVFFVFFFSSRRRHTRCSRDWSSDVCSSDLDEADEREDEERTEHHGVVAIENALETEQSEPVQLEDRLDQKRAREEGVNEGAGEAGDDNQHRVAEDVTIEYPIFAAAFRARGHHVLLADLVQKRVLGQERHGGER